MECASSQYCARINSVAAVSIVHLYLWCVLRVNTVQGSALQQYSLVQFWQCYGARVKLLGWSRNWFFMSASAQTVKSRIYNPSNWCFLSFTVFTTLCVGRSLVFAPLTRPELICLNNISEDDRCIEGRCQRICTPDKPCDPEEICDEGLCIKIFVSFHKYSLVLMYKPH